MAGILFLRLGWTDDPDKQRDRMDAVGAMAKKLSDVVLPGLGVTGVRVVVLAGVDDAFFVPDDGPAETGEDDVATLAGPRDADGRLIFDSSDPRDTLSWDDLSIGRVERTETGLEVEIVSEPGLSDEERGPVIVPPVDSGDLAP